MVPSLLAPRPEPSGPGTLTKDQSAAPWGKSSSDVKSRCFEIRDRVRRLETAKKPEFSRPGVRLDQHRACRIWIVL